MPSISSDLTMEMIELEEEGVMEGFLGAIRPPKLEDAGLEDCALSTELIMEAFSRATASFKSRVVFSFSSSADESFDGEGGGCVQDPGPSNGQMPDKLIGADEIFPPLGPFCGDGGKEEKQEGAKDEVVIVGAGGGELDTDRVVILGGGGDEEEGRESNFGGKRGCTVGGEVLPGGKNGRASDGDLEEDDENKDRPILIEELI